jgi:thiamine-phosphate pyrophosphorylase
VPRPGNLLRPILCYVTDRQSLAGESAQVKKQALLALIEAFAEAGLDWIQIREKECSGQELAAFTSEAQRRAAESSTGSEPPLKIIVNDRLDVVIANRSDGVHLGEKSLPAAETKRLLRNSLPGQQPLNEILVGVSCHSVEAAQDAARDGADYIFFGPVFATPSKAAFGPPQGLERLAEACASVSIPVLAIGGITLESAASCLASGASGIAAIHLFQDALRPARLLATLRNLSF